MKSALPISENGAATPNHLTAGGTFHVQITAPRPRLHISADDHRQTGFAGLLLPGELARSLDVVARLDSGVTGFKDRDRGAGAGELLVSLAETMLAGGNHLAHLDVLRKDEASAQLRCVAELPARTTAGQLLRRFGEAQVAAAMRVISAAGIGHDAHLELDPAAPVTLDIDATTTEVYGRKKEGAVYNYKGQRSYQSQVITWAERNRSVAAKLLEGSAAEAPTAPDLIDAALSALPPDHGQVSFRADTAYYAMDVLHRCRDRGIRFAVAVKRSKPMWRLAATVDPDRWQQAKDMPQAEVAETVYSPQDWKHEPLRLLIRRVRLDRDDIGDSPRCRRRATVPKEQLTLLLGGEVDHVYGYSFIITDKSGNAVNLEYWHRHRTDIEERFRDVKLDCGLIHLPCGTMNANRGWMVAALLATNMMAMLSDTLMKAAPHNQTPAEEEPREPRYRTTPTMRRWLIAVPGRLVRGGRKLQLRLPASLWWADEFMRTYDMLRAFST